MEFVQFHPTGMVWPPGVRGLLVTEAVRGEGGILRNTDGERFMWRYLPEDRRHEYAATDEEARAWVDALTDGRQTDHRRPPELSTRDNVARAIYTEVREGRGTPHGGVFLDISYLPAERVRRKLPSMYDQFKELADVDITAGPMEVGPTMHYMMGGVRVEPRRARRPSPGLYAAGEVAGGLHGSNRLGGNSLSDLLVFGQRAGEAAAGVGARERSAPTTPAGRVASAESVAARSTRRSSGPRRGPHRLHEDLQADDADAGRHLPDREDLEAALARLDELEARMAARARHGPALVQPDLGPRLRAAEHAHRVRGRRALGARCARRAAGRTAGSITRHARRSGTM